MTPLLLSPLDLAIAALLLVGSACLSVWLSLGVQRPLLVSAARMVVQLLLVGLILQKVLATASPWLTALVVLAMMGAASHAVGTRQRQGLRGPWMLGLSTAVVSVTTLAVTLLALQTALRPEPWYDARLAIPLAGIVLGGVMNAASLALNDLFHAVRRERTAIEARLALGASRREAFQGVVRRAVLTGIMPHVNQMTAAGIITLPGIMTGQVLAGMDPMEAAKYQILLMCLLGAGSLLAAVGATSLAVRRLSDTRDRLRLDRLRDPARTGRRP
ncbi:YbbM seven transmembrane helix protein [plant metagenome]|uniref:YbbM seven transmembrane helix protein n=1 Tax=plant metagenome TaxID=1297885 RepID=A0A484P449_9ZZZZ